MKGGANPHTRNVLGLRKRVDAERARRQWHSLAKTLGGLGVEVLMVEPHQDLFGSVYPANAGFLLPLEDASAEKKAFYLANLLPTRAGEQIYRNAIESLGLTTKTLQARFEGEADFFPPAHT